MAPGDHTVVAPANFSNQRMANRLSILLIFKINIPAKLGSNLIYNL